MLRDTLGVQIMQVYLFSSVLINTVYSLRMGGNCSVQEYARYFDRITCGVFVCSLVLHFCLMQSASTTWNGFY